MGLKDVMDELEAGPAWDDYSLCPKLADAYQQLKEQGKEAEAQEAVVLHLLIFA
jgi:hypothetical protein